MIHHISILPHLFAVNFQKIALACCYNYYSYSLLYFRIFHFYNKKHCGGRKQTGPGEPYDHPHVSCTGDNKIYMCLWKGQQVWLLKILNLQSNAPEDLHTHTLTGQGDLQSIFFFIYRKIFQGKQILYKSHVCEYIKNKSWIFMKCAVKSVIKTFTGIIIIEVDGAHYC